MCVLIDVVGLFLLSPQFSVRSVLGHVFGAVCAHHPCQARLDEDAVWTGWAVRGGEGSVSVGLALGEAVRVGPLFCDVR